MIVKKDFLVRSPRAPEETEFDIAYFAPADVEGMNSWWPASDRKFIIADTGFGDPYYIELSQRQPDALPVYLFYHDGGDTFLVAESLKQFITWCKQARPNQ